MVRLLFVPGEPRRYPALPIHTMKLSSIFFHAKIGAIVGVAVTIGGCNWALAEAAEAPGESGAYGGAFAVTMLIFCIAVPACAFVSVGIRSLYDLLTIHEINATATTLTGSSGANHWLKAECDSCGKEIDAPPAMAGLTGKCPKCDTPFTFPDVRG